MDAGVHTVRLIQPILLALTLWGCAAVQIPTNYRPQTTGISMPELGTDSVAQVGDTMVHQGRLTVHDAILLRSEVSFAVGTYLLKPGYYLKVGEDHESEFYVPDGGVDGGAIVKAPMAAAATAVKGYKTGPRLCVITAAQAVCTPAPVIFERAQRPVASSASFEQKLLYSGRVGNKIRIGYREFSNNLARPAFSNDVEYDLSDSRVIGYKGARIQVLEATNEHIKYKLIQHFAPNPF